jgi:hypothetical protein
MERGDCGKASDVLSKDKSIQTWGRGQVLGNSVPRLGQGIRKEIGRPRAGLGGCSVAERLPSTLGSTPSTTHKHTHTHTHTHTHKGYCCP